MTHYEVFKHSTSNKLNIYKNNQKNQIVITRKALEIILKKYVLVIENTYQIINQGWIHMKFVEKFPT